MSILIKGLKMPRKCEECRICHYEEHGEIIFCGCLATMKIRQISCFDKPDWCPLAEIPPHGRLIDADAFDERVRLAGGMADEELSDDFKDGIQTTLLLLKSQRTVIEAEPCNDLAKPNNNIFVVQDTDEDEGLFAAKPIDYMHTPSVEEIIKGDGE